MKKREKVEKLFRDDEAAFFFAYTVFVRKAAKKSRRCRTDGADIFWTR
jgi:hypothetical protein